MRAGSSRSRWAWLALWFLVPGLITAAAAPTRLGVLTTDSSGDALADLLTVELSRLDGVTVLERKELERIVREQSLGPLASPGLLKAGAIAGAEGLVILEPRGIAGGLSVNLRVVGVHHGVALGWWDSTVPTNAFPDWPKGAVSRIRRLLPKLSSSERRIAPISFVGFTSPLTVPDSMLLEREINSLLLNRLGAEPDLIVLERRKLLESAFEKVLSGDERAFWNGACLLDGTINPEGLSGQSVTVRFRLLGPDGSPAGESVLSGSRTNLGEIAAEFVNRVRSALKVGDSRVSWDASAEARRFHDEAELASRWGFWPEACAAADSALALGKGDGDTQDLRLTAYAGFLGSVHNRASHLCRPSYDVLRGYMVPPPQESLSIALNLACQIRDAVHIRDVVFVRERAGKATAQALEEIGWLTFTYYMGAELRRGNGERLADLRAIMREVTEELLDTSGTERSREAGVGFQQATAFRRAENAKGVFMAVAKFGPLWQETPEGAVYLNRRVKVLFGFEVLHEQLLEPLPWRTMLWSEWTPELCGWKWLDRQRTEEVGSRSAAEDLLLDQCRARLVTIGASESDAALQRNCQAAVEFFLAHAGQLKGLGCRTSFARVFAEYWRWQEGLVAPGVREGMLTNEVAQLGGVLAAIDESTVNQRFPAVQSYFLPLNRPVERLRLSLAKNQVPPVDILRKLAFWPVKDDIPGALEALNRVLELPESPEKEAVLPEVGRQIALLRAKVAPRVPPASKPSDSLTPPPMLRVTGTTNVFSLLTSIGLPPAATERRIEAVFHALPAAPQGNRVVWMEEKLWLGYIVTRQEQYAVGNRGSGLRIIDDTWLGMLDFRTGAREELLIPRRFMADRIGGMPEFAVFPGRLVFCFPDQLVAYDRAKKDFSGIPSPLKSPRLLQTGRRLLLWNAETILETTEELKEFRVLASVRRRPALGALDGLSTLEQVQVISAGEHILYASFTNQLYRLEGERWLPLLEPAWRQSAEVFPGEFLAREVRQIDERSNRLRVRYFGPAAPMGELWWTAREIPNPPGMWPWQSKLVLDLDERGGNRSVFPTSGDLLLFQGNLATISFPQLPGHPRMDCWHADLLHPVRFTVQGRGRAIAERHFGVNSRSPAYLRFPYYFFCSAGRDVLIWHSQVPGIWRLTGEELLSRFHEAAAVELSRIEAQKRRLASIMSDFDANLNNVLDSAEYPALAQEPALFNLTWKGLDRDGNDMIEYDEIKWFDFNRDLRLDAVEHEAFLNAVSFLASAAFCSLDISQDGRLQEREMANYVDSIFLSPGIFRKYDPEEKGALDLRSWTDLIAEVLHRRWAAMPARPGMAEAGPPLYQYHLEKGFVEQFLGGAPGNRQEP